MKQPRFRPNRCSIRGLLVVGIEIMALSSLLLRDLVLAAMLQVLAVLVLSVHQLDRRLPTVADRADEARAPRDSTPYPEGEAPRELSPRATIPPEKLSTTSPSRTVGTD